MNLAPRGTQPDGGDDAQPAADPVRSPGPAAGHALVAAYDIRVVTRVLQALKRVAPGLTPHAAEGGSALNPSLTALRPALVLVDLNLIEYSPRELVGQARAANPDTRVVVIAGHGDDDRVVPALRAGAAGFLLKHDSLDDLCGQLRSVLAGALPLTPALARQLLRHLDWTGLVAQVASAELELLTWISLGDTAAEVAARMQLEREALRRHIRHVFDVLQLPGAGAAY